MKNPQASIITVVRNGEHLIERTIKSIINQTFTDFEYIIIDGASTDGTVNVIKKYQKHISHWISEPDKSHFDAMNKGLKMAKGKYVWYIHAGDEICYKNTLERIFSQNQNADAYYGETVLTNMNGDEVDTFRRRAPEQLSWKKMNRGMAVCHQSFIIKKELAQQYDYKNFPYSADHDWIIKCLKQCSSVVNTKMILSRFLAGGISKKHKMASWLERFRLLSKHFGLARSITNHFIITATYPVRIFRPSPAQLREELNAKNKIFD